jgi:hypothetical protein
MDKADQKTRSVPPLDSNPPGLNGPPTRNGRSQRPAWSVPEHPISIRFEPEMLERLDRVASQLSKANPNIRIGRSSVVKLAMERALKALEAELSIRTT